MKKLVYIFLIIFLAFPIINKSNLTVIANSSIQDEIYSIYDERLNLLFQKDFVAVGDEYLSNDFKMYQVVFVDDDTKKGFAKFLKNVDIPKVNYSYIPKPISQKERKICMYMTHNDESYINGDGVDSVYGNGGIKDVALALKSEFEKNMVTVYFDDTLHIPHDTKAYSRSSNTAKQLFNEHKPDAIFDIHRDATSRAFYSANVNGVERSKIRIVIGKSNPNKAINEEFALYIMAVANEMYPWLITDIYYGSGHYNQSVDGKALLFEMGTYLMDKSKVIESTRELAEVVTTALFGTTVNEDTGDLTINGIEDENNIIVKDYIEEKQQHNLGTFKLVIFTIVIVGISVFLLFIVTKRLRKN